MKGVLLKVEILGSGGAITTPRPGCECRICAEAREKGVPYSRSGPSTFVHGPDVLLDTPEESKEQLNRSRVREIAACFYSHWHPDHVMGRRVWETRNYDWRAWPPDPRTTDVYLPRRVAEDFRKRLASWEHFEYFAHLGVVRLHEVPDGESVTINGTRITPIRLAEEYVYAFLFEGEDRRLLVAPDELNGWHPTSEVRGVDLAVIPMGICDVHPLTGERQIPEEHPILKEEATFEETLGIVRELGAKRVVLSHIEETDQLSYDDLIELGRRLRAEELPVEFAYDTMLLEVG